MSAVDIATSVFRVFADLAPLAGRALAAGASEQALLQSLAREVALARVAARAGRAIRPLAVAAVDLGDIAARLRILGRPGDARLLDELAARLRADAVLG